MRQICLKSHSRRWRRYPLWVSGKAKWNSGAWSCALAPPRCTHIAEYRKAMFPLVCWHEFCSPAHTRDMWLVHFRTSQWRRSGLHWHTPIQSPHTHKKNLPLTHMMGAGFLCVSKVLMCIYAAEPTWVYLNSRTATLATTTWEKGVLFSSCLPLMHLDATQRNQAENLQLSVTQSAVVLDQSQWTCRTDACKCFLASNSILNVLFLSSNPGIKSRFKPELHGSRSSRL